MKKLTITVALLLLTCIPAFAQTDKEAAKLADTMAEAFSNGLDRPAIDKLLRGRLQVSIQNWIGEPEFESKRFKTFTAMERWLKSEENQPGFPVRTSGERVSCGGGLCKLALNDGQMANNHVYLTRVWYGRDKRGLYVKKIRILYG